MNKKREVKDLIETLHDTLLIRLTHTHATGTHLTQPEHTLNNTQLRRSSIETSHSQPVVNDHPGTNNGATTVHTTSDKGHLQQGRKFVLVTDGGFGVDDTTLVGEGHVGACQDVVGDGLAEDFDAKNVGNSTQLASIPFIAQYRVERQGGAYISSVSRSISGCTRATWSLQQMTFPNAERRSSIRWILTWSGRVFRRCCNSWSVVVVGTRRPLRFLFVY